MSQRLVIKCRDPKTGKASTLEATGSPEEILRSVEKFEEFLKRRGLEIVDWKMDLEGGVANMKTNEDCLLCGGTAKLVLKHETKMPDGLVTALIRMPLCPKDFKQYKKNEKVRLQAWSLGIKRHLAGEMM